MQSNVRRVNFTNRTIIPDKPEGQVADLENGYLRLANQIQDAVCKVELSGREFRVLNAVIRLTYGWSKKEDRITNSLISDKTELAVKHVSEAVVSLATRRIILLRRIGQTRYIGINTDLNKWAYTKPKCKSCVVSFPSLEESISFLIETIIPDFRDGMNDGKTIPDKRENHPRKQGEVSPKTGNTKDILPKTKKQTNNPLNPPRGKVDKFDPLSISIPDWLNQQAWIDWVSNRAETKKPFKTERGIMAAFKLLKECLDEGHDPVDVINASIANGYQGLFKPKFPIRKQVPVQQTSQHWNSREAWENEFL